MFKGRVSDDVRATRLASKLMRFCVSGDALETIRAAPPEPPATTMLNAPLGVFSMGAPLVSSGRNCICPDICCRASRCRLPMGRAFAVKVSLRMDAGVICNVRRAHPCHVARRRRSGGAWRAADLHAGGRAGHKLQSPHGGGRSGKVGNRRKTGGSAVHGNRATRLARCQRPRICSDGDAMRGFEDGRRRWSGAFLVLRQGRQLRPCRCPSP